MAERRCLLVGGGHAHVELLRRVAARRRRRELQITLVSEAPFAIYSGMLPACLARLYRPADIRIDLRALAARAGAAWRTDRMSGLDPSARIVRFESGDAVSYDVLSLNLGSIARGMELPGVRAHALATRPIAGLLAGVEAFDARAEALGRPPRVVVVGAGAAGVELAFALSARYRALKAEVRLIEGGRCLLPGYSKRARRAAGRALSVRGIALELGAPVAEVTREAVVSSGGARFVYDLLVWASGPAAPGLLARCGLELDRDSFVRVRPSLQTVSSDAVFAAGDCASWAGGLPKAGVFAVRQGPLLAANLLDDAAGLPLRDYRPQRRFLTLLMTGDGEAILNRGRLGASGRWVWWLKDRIDRRWINLAGLGVRS